MKTRVARPKVGPVLTETLRSDMEVSLLGVSEVVEKTKDFVVVPDVVDNILMDTVQAFFQ